MEIAFIPPEGLHERIWEGRVAMALAPLFLDSSLGSKEYCGIMSAYRSWSSNIMLLDNGAAEGQMVDGTVLVDLCTRYHPTEVVAPDKLGDAKETQFRVGDHLMHSRIIGQKYMAVAQGRSMQDLHECVDYFNSFDKIRTIGIPRLVLDTVGKSARLDLTSWINQKYDGRFLIHLLGTNPVWVKEIYYAAKYNPYIRSVDTSLPYNYAIAGERLDTSKEQIKRPLGYFARSWRDDIKIELVKHNEQVIKNWLAEAGK